LKVRGRLSVKTVTTTIHPLTQTPAGAPNHQRLRENSRHDRTPPAGAHIYTITRSASRDDWS
jgi:hypothetical protein